MSGEREKVTGLEKSKTGTLTVSAMWYVFKNENSKVKYQVTSLKISISLLLRFNDYDFSLKRSSS